MGIRSTEPRQEAMADAVPNPFDALRHIDCYICRAKTLKTLLIETRYNSAQYQEFLSQEQEFYRWVIDMPNNTTAPWDLPCPMHPASTA